MLLNFSKHLKTFNIYYYSFKQIKTVCYPRIFPRKNDVRTLGRAKNATGTLGRTKNATGPGTLSLVLFHHP